MYCVVGYSILATLCIFVSAAVFTMKIGTAAEEYWFQALWPIYVYMQYSLFFVFFTADYVYMCVCV